MKALSFADDAFYGFYKEDHPCLKKIKQQIIEKKNNSFGRIYDNMTDMKNVFKEEYRKMKSAYIPNAPYEERLSQKELILNSYLTKLKKEADSLYYGNNPYGIIDWTDKDNVHDDLYHFCWALPKGGDLHAHDNTMIPFDKFVEIIKEYAMISLNGDTYGTLYTKYTPELPKDAVSVSEALEKGMISDKELNEMLVLSDQDAEKGYWTKLEQVFSATGDIYNDVSFMAKVWEEGFLSCYEKGISLLEIRDWCGEDDLDNFIRDRTIREAYYRVRRIHPDFLVRLIACSGKDSGSSVESAMETLRSAIRVSQTIKDEFDPEHPEDFIIGLDLVNEEDNSKPLSEYAEFLLSDEIRNCGLGLYLHCGESLRMDNDSVVDAYLVNPVRVGHALNLYRFPKLLEKFKEKHIAIEVCMMSNYRLGYVKDLRLHPGLQYMMSGIPIVLCSDDGLFMSSAPMVDDFYAAILSWDMNLSDIKTVCRNSLLCSGLTEEENQRLITSWEKRWESFVNEELKLLQKYAD